MSFSDRARIDAEQSRWSTLDSPNEITRAILDAAHDREALGLDASARISDILDEAAQKIHGLAAKALAMGDAQSANTYTTAANIMLLDFEPSP